MKKNSVKGITEGELLEIATLINDLYWRSNHYQGPDSAADMLALEVSKVFKSQHINLGLSVGPCECKEEDRMDCYLKNAQSVKQESAA